MINIGLCGSTGKMGKMIIERIGRFDSCKISSTFSRQNNINDLDEFCRNSQVIIDFSNGVLLEKLLESAIKYQNKLVIGTTGFESKLSDLMYSASKDIAILYSANMSLGINLLAILTEKAAKILDKNYDIEILESHHRMKLDIPSGTAIMFGKTLAEARNLDFNKDVIHNRHGKRLSGEIGIASIRGGQVYGEHEIMFLGVNETISFKHQALNRESFADGAIKAANWIANKKAGLYSMLDVLGQLLGLPISFYVLIPTKIL
ncbi:MAG: 4-hydroxy-tetrahydrodipicolinate reductase [Rickettsia endosymbiont of Bryobia graminum]|nr:4-hydroxy-tetrahydrodipicolinate reductase [Rickettsia endosymbiont of Bryobia graminum]